MANVLSKELKYTCCNKNPENVHGDCFQCEYHITNTNLTYDEVDKYMNILEEMENACYTLCDNCAYKLCWMYYMSKLMSNASKMQHYLAKYENAALFR